MTGGPTEGTSLRELLRERRAEIQAAASRPGPVLPKDRLPGWGSGG